MPIFEVKITGADKPRLVQATSGATARAHVAEAKAISAERMAELLGDGIELEKAGAKAEADAKRDEKPNSDPAAATDETRGKEEVEAIIDAANAGAAKSKGAAK